MKELIFQLEDVYFSYLGRYPALCGIDIEIHRGERVAIIGANGTGKSTLLQLLDGLFFADRGKILFSGEPLSPELFLNPQFSQKFRSQVGFVFQNPDIQLFSPSVKEDIAFGPLQLGISEGQTKKRLEKICALFEIGHLLERQPQRLSIGEKRKVALASTLAIEPEVIILDEPTAGLDPKTVRHIVDLINQAAEEGKTIITATQDLHIVEEISDLVYVFNAERKIAKCGATAEVLADTAFLEAHNLVHIHSHRHKGEVHTHPHQHLNHHP